jgi:hypothetical protein
LRIAQVTGLGIEAPVSESVLSQLVDIAVNGQSSYRVSKDRKDVRLRLSGGESAIHQQ